MSDSDEIVVIARQTPIASFNDMETRFKRWAVEFGFPPPWRFFVVAHDHREGDWADADDHACYAHCQREPQYHRAVFHYDPWHDGWDKEPDLDLAVAHEVGHAFVGNWSVAVEYAINTIRSPAIVSLVQQLIDDHEDEVVNRLASLVVTFVRQRDEARPCQTVPSS